MPLKGEEELAAEMRHAPTAELGSRIFESSEAVVRVATCSNNLQGPVKTSVREVELERTVAELGARVSELEARLMRGSDAAARVSAVPPPVDPPVSVSVPSARSGPSSAVPVVSGRPATSGPAPAVPSQEPAMCSTLALAPGLAPAVGVKGLIRRLCGEMEVRLASRLGAVSSVAAARGALPRVPRVAPPSPARDPGPSGVGSRSGAGKEQSAKKKRRKKKGEKWKAGGGAAPPAPALPGRGRPRAAPVPAASWARPSAAPAAPSLPCTAPETWSKVL
ncbi:nematocyst expressed protein 3-like [Hylaeus volcanicus]|uniref:nematocyst expressed protein 3-like n=1 Tax=Hylaeus volcanicus TaxID=313075 RepID=UPI0023B7AC8C|nr:nematocyst expressed protein 3-like [Hylaeus volcanicus]